MGAIAAGCGDDDDGGDSGDSGGGGGDVGKVAVLLPDSKSSVRWETVDRPFLQKAFDDAGVEADISNAEGDKSTQQQQAEQAITNGAKVHPAREPGLRLGRGDRGEREVAGREGDRLRPPDARHGRPRTTTSRSTTRRSASSRAQGLVDCVGNKQGAQIAVLNGSPTDNNATLFKNGYDSVINPKFESGDWKEIDDQSVPDWDNQKALTIFEQMLQANDNKVDGVLAANDGLGNAAISALKQRKLPQVPVTGQDATLEGIQNIVNGDQCMTVYKAIKKEADAAAELAIALAKGEKPNATTTPIDNGTKKVPSVLLDAGRDHEGQHQGVPRRAGLPQARKRSAPGSSPRSARSSASSADRRSPGAPHGAPGRPPRN